MSEVLRQLEATLPTQELNLDADVIEAYSRDQAGLCPSGKAIALVMAKSVTTIQETLRWAHTHTIPVVTRGAGTGLSGGANAIDGAVILCLEKMNRILEIDPQTRTARVEPGVINLDLDNAAREHGLMYPPDPASRDISSIGGNVATNAGGACCLKYGVTGDHVAQLKAVLADGSEITAGAVTVKNVAGLDLKRLLIGSEGTLAVITEITVRLLPRRPAVGTVAAFFADLSSAGKAVVALEAPKNLSKLEIMDQTTLIAVDELTHMELDRSSAALVLAQVDSSESAKVIEEAEQLCFRLGASFVATTLDAHEGQLLMQARGAALPALERKGHCLLDDVAVPVPRIPELLAACEAISSEFGVTIGTFGHAGDGNLHPTIVYDHLDEDSRVAALKAFDAIVEAAVKLGGTITGEHGVGNLKQRFLERMVGSKEHQLMCGIKKVFDSKSILNPGKGY